MVHVVLSFNIKIRLRYKENEQTYHSLLIFFKNPIINILYKCYITQ